MAATYPELPIGSRERSPGRTLTEAEVVGLNLLCGAGAARHLNRALGEASPAGERVLAPSIALALLSAGWGASRLSAQLASETGLRWIAAHGVQADFLAPVAVGDTLYGEYVLDSVEEQSDRPGRAILHVRVLGLNQRGEQVLDGLLDALFEYPRQGTG